VKFIKYPTKETEKCKNEAPDIPWELDKPTDLCSIKEMFTPQEVMGMLYISRTKVYELLRTGELAYIRVGSGYRIPCYELMRYMRSNKNV